MGQGQLDPFIKRGRMWVHTAAASKPAVVKMHEIKQGKTRWLKATVTKELPRSVDFYGLYGTYRYGKTDVLLHYYARHTAVKSRDQLPSIAKASHLVFAIADPFLTSKGESCRRRKFSNNCTQTGRKAYNQR